MVTGRFIAFLGIPGAGKSTTCLEFAALAGGLALLEPSTWPRAVTDPFFAGSFTALSWFRAMRVPMYYQALSARHDGQVAVLDTYYDKICIHLLGAAGFDWFLSTRDSYFDLYQEIARRDWQELPLADLVVVFRIEEQIWRQFVRDRNRSWDYEWGIDRIFSAQRRIQAAAEELHRAFGLPIHVFDQTRASPKIAAKRLFHELRDRGLIE